jgi:hypothetical protein
MAEYNLTYDKAVSVLVNTRKIKKISQRDMCGLTKYGLNTIVKFEAAAKGNDGYKNMDVLMAYCKALGASFKINVHTEKAAM